MTANNYSSLLKYISMMKRDTNRYFQLKLKKFNLGGGQQFFLLRIAENPGISMYDLARTGAFDKATVTKAVNKLLAEGYITKQGLDENGEIIGYEYVAIGSLMKSIREGVDVKEALQKATKTYGRFKEAVTIIDPRRAE